MLAYYNEDIPMVRQSIILRGVELCSFDRPYSWRWSPETGWHTALPRAWVCPFCLDVWAKSTIDGEGRAFVIEPAPCGCTPAPFAGSLIPLAPFSFDDPSFIDHAPKEFLQREIAIAMTGEGK